MTKNKHSLQLTVENLIPSLIGAVSISREAHIKLINSNKESDEQKLGIIDYETISEIEDMLRYGFCNAFNLTEDGFKELLNRDHITNQDIVTCLIEDNIHNQRLVYNPSKLTWNSNYELNAIALSGGNLSTLLYLLSLSPSLAKLTASMVLDNVSKGDTVTDSHLNILILLEEIAGSIVQGPSKLITNILDKIFDRNCDFLSDVLSKQVIHVLYDRGCVTLNLKGDHRVIILDKLIKGMYLYEDPDTVFEENIKLKPKDLISKALPKLNTTLLENYMKQSFHSFSKKK